MDIHAESVSETVTKIFGEVFLVEDCAGMAVDFSSIATGCEEVAAFIFGLEDEIIDFFVAVRSFADNEGACDVAAVTVEFSAAVDGDEVAFCDQSFAGVGVRFGRIGSAGDDRVEGDFGTVTAIEKFDIEADVVLRSSGLDQPGDVPNACVSEFAGFFDAPNFIGVFDHPEVADHVGGVDPLEFAQGFGALFPCGVAY